MGEFTKSKGNKAGEPEPDEDKKQDHLRVSVTGIFFTIV